MLQGRLTVLILKLISLDREIILFAIVYTFLNRCSNKKERMIDWNWNLANEFYRTTSYMVILSEWLKLSVSQKCVKFVIWVLWFMAFHRTQMTCFVYVFCLVVKCRSAEATVTQRYREIGTHTNIQTRRKTYRPLLYVFLASLNLFQRCTPSSGSWLEI